MAHPPSLRRRAIHHGIGLTGAAHRLVQILSRDTPATHA
jgi:hypothetical protein